MLIGGGAFKPVSFVDRLGMLSDGSLMLVEQWVEFLLMLESDETYPREGGVCSRPVTAMPIALPVNLRLLPRSGSATDRNHS